MRTDRIVVAALAVAGCALARAQEPSQPNVVLLVSDDQGWADVGYNNPKVYSPRIDALAASGLRFAQSYAMPQCTPTRVALLTGRYPGRFGAAALQASNALAIPHGTPTLASLFGAHGYATFLSGKWHLGSQPEDGPNHFGFDSSYGSLAGAVGMYDHRYRAGRFARTWHRDHEILDRAENGVHATDLVTDEAVRVIEAERDLPFFLYVAFHSVHTPLDERGKFVDRPTQPDPDDPTRWLGEDEIEWFHDPKRVIQGERDPERRLFLAAVHHLDHAVGRIVDALERSGQRENTLIVFTSDNGPQGSWPGGAYPDDLALSDFNQPLPMRGKKLDVWEGGIHVPAFAVWPGRIAPGELRDPVHVVDWFATFATLLGHRDELDRGRDGIDLGPALFDREPLPERDLYWIWNVRTDRWALRRGTWKIVHYGRDEPTSPAAWQLFDLAHDPAEQHDVAADNPDTVADLHRAFLAHRARDARW